MASHSNPDRLRIVSSKSAASAAAGLTDLTQTTITGAADLCEPNNAPEASSVAFIKGGKRKRLSKACDACHKSKRRCDGTAPCSNCYFASKECTYTDSSGRPVPAPRNIHPQLGVDHLAIDVNAASTYRRDVPPTAARPYPHDEPSSSSRGMHRFAESPTNAAATKRVRPEGADTSATIISPLGSPSGSASGSSSSLLDPTTTHELTNLFFTHCNPGRMIIHKPSFSASLTHEQLPSYLILAVCANAAPHSKDVASKAPTTRLAGVPFFTEAVSIMFDASGRLLAEPNLSTAQALCLLELHEVSASHSWTKHYRYFDLALKILEESLDVSRADEPELTTPPLSPGARTVCIERECTRRCFWLIQVMCWINGIYTFRPLRPRSIDLMRHVRLPADETSFELAVPVQGPGEFMHIPAPRSKNASQFGHLCRILSLYQKLQAELSTKEGAEKVHAVNDIKKGLKIWVDSLADHLRFSEANLERQVSMFETSSNTGAWSFCFMHVLHPCLVLSMTEVDGREAEVVGWVRSQLNTVFTAIGGRAKNTILSACALWSYSKYQPHDPQLHKWDDDFERIWGFRVAVVADQWRKCQEEQRSQIGRTYPVDSISTQESPPAFTVADSSPSSTGSSPHELEPQQNHPDRGFLVVDLTDHESGRHGYITNPPPDPDQIMAIPPSSAPSKQRDSLSLPSLKASGLLDSWNMKPPTDAFAYSVSISPRAPRNAQQKDDHSPPHPQHLQQQQQQPYSHPHSQQQQPLSHHHTQQHRPPASTLGMHHHHPQPHPQPQSSGRTAGQSMPVGLNWLNSEP